jgi:hypothetical protein
LLIQAASSTDAGAERLFRRQAQPQPADLGARPRQADVGVRDWIGGILRTPISASLWQSTPVAELLLARLPSPSRLGLMADHALIVAIPISAWPFPGHQPATMSAALSRS